VEKLPKKTSGKSKAEKTALYDDHDVDEITAPFQFVDENAMPWGGEHSHVKFYNTCTIDNIMMAFFIIFISREDIRGLLEKTMDTAIHAVLELCMNDMKKRRWSLAKDKLLRDIAGQREVKDVHSNLGELTM